MHITEILLGLLLVLPLVAEGEPFEGDPFAKQVLEECLKEVQTSVNRTEHAMRPGLKNPGSVSSPRTGHISKHRIRQHSPSQLHLSFAFPSHASSSLASPREVIQCAVDKVKAKGDVISPETFKEISKEAGCKARDPPDCSDWCFHRKYRTIDGTCNNLEHPTWGASLIPFKRLIPAVYEDGWDKPVGWSGGKVNGQHLPSARKVSTDILSASQVGEDPDNNYMLMQWGQFIDHDTDLSPTNPSKEGFISGIPCSSNCKNEMPCFPIPVPEDDERIKSVQCIGFIRTASICGDSLDSPRDQLNEITSLIDASNVYGSTAEDNQFLRDPGNPEYLVHGEEIEGKYYLPIDATNEFAACEIDTRRDDSPCFRAGDKRSNEQLGLTMMHTVFHREHNRIVDWLKTLGNNWDAETTYQEARKILIAEIQTITYQEWLPKLIGDEGMAMLGDYTGYKPDVDPSVSNNFATASYRVGHTLIIPEVPRLGKDFEPIPEGNLPIHMTFFAPYLFREDGGMDPIINGWLHTPGKKVDPSKMMNTEIIEKLFKLAHEVALDLGALNVQRGRDHGLAPYTSFRKYCGFGKTKDFDDLKIHISSIETLTKLKNLYGHVDNIDLFVGGIAEDPVGNGHLGPTLLCLVVDQFKRLRDGDRFYYENPSVFTESQLAQLKNATLARVLCDNGDDIERVQPDAFLKVEYPGGYKSCADMMAIPIVDLYEWKEEEAEESTVDGGTKYSGSPPTSDQICCCGTLYGSSENPVTVEKYHCCGNKVYDPERDTCCDGVLQSGQKESTYKCCGNKAFDPLNEYCRDGQVVAGENSPHCGKVSYDPSKKICCGGSLYSKKKTTTCCGNQAYNPDKEICCNGFVKKMETHYVQCCGFNTYDPRHQVCCAGSVIDTHPGSGSCNVKMESCCCGAITKKRPFRSSDSCCGTVPYGLNQKLCCNGNLIDGNPGKDRCCGTKVYNPSKQTCCDTGSDLEVLEGVDSCLPPTGHSCAGKSYNAAKKVCCRGKIFPGGDNVRCCGGEAYNSSTQVCCLNKTCHHAVYKRDDPDGCSIDVNGTDQ